MMVTTVPPCLVVEPAQIVPSARPGMGSQPYAGGTSFRVWAPHAGQVYVAGSFNKWSALDHPLASEGNGYWSVDVDGAFIDDQYKYVVVNGDTRYWRNDPYARQVTNSSGNSVIISTQHDWGPPTDYRTPAWNEAVIYEMHIGTFFDEPGGGPGNFHSAIEMLPHLVELGINVIQVMPTFEFAGGFSWGYNPAHLFAIESDYGGPHALKDFIAAAHRAGIAVIIDVVYNHFGPSDLDLWQFDGWHEGNYGGIYFYNDWRGNTPWGPRPDYGRSEVRQFIRDNALMWLEEFQADGLRWDATAYMRNAYGRDNDPMHDIHDGWWIMQWVNREIRQHQPWKISIAEDMRGNRWVTKRVNSGGAGFDSQWDNDFVHAVRRAVITRNDSDRKLWEVRNAIENRYDSDSFSRVIYTESHDEVANGKARVPEEIWSDNPGSYYSRKRSTLGAAVVLTSPGIPLIFQGQELLEDEWFQDTDPLDWSKKERYRGIFQMYADLIRLRRNWFNNTRGLRGQLVNVFHVNETDKVLAFHRWQYGGAGDDVVIVVNFSDRSFANYNIGLPQEGWWRVRFNSDWNGYSNDFSNHPCFDTYAHSGQQHGLPFQANVGIGPYSVIILSQDG